MLRNWVSTAERMPESGALVSFLVDRRTVWLAGTYRYGCFKSRWGHYDAGTVKHWRPLRPNDQARLELVKEQA